MKKIIYLSVLSVLFVLMANPVIAEDTRSDIKFEKTEYRDSLYCNDKLPTQKQIENALWKLWPHGTKKIDLVDIEKINNNIWMLYFTRLFPKETTQQSRQCFLKRLDNNYWVIYTTFDTIFIHKFTNKK